MILPAGDPAGGMLVKRAGSLTAIVALAACLAAPAWARVGVTSVTDGGTSVTPGSDLQAGQQIATGADGRVHLMFLDGSAVTVGPNSVLTIERFAYDPAGKTGEMTLNVQQGTVRLVGGAIGKSRDIEIRTPSGSVGLRGGIAAVTVGNGGATTADFLSGSAMRVTGQGITQTATRTGSQISLLPGGQPTRAAVLAPGQLTNLQSLDRASTGARVPAPSVDAALAKVELSRHNSGVVSHQPVAGASNQLVTFTQTANQGVLSAQTRQQQLPTLQQQPEQPQPIPAPVPALASAPLPQPIAPSVSTQSPAATAASTKPASSGGALTITGSTGGSTNAGTLSGTGGLTKTGSSVTSVTMTSGGTTANVGGTYSGSGTVSLGSGTLTLMGTTTTKAGTVAVGTVAGTGK